IERERLTGFWREIVLGEAGSDEKTVRMSRHVGAVQARVRVVHELRHREVVEHRGKRMEVVLETRLGRPAVERDAAFVGRVAFGHPFGFLYAEGVEEAAQPGRGALADADDADRRG